MLPQMSQVPNQTMGAVQVGHTAGSGQHTVRYQAAHKVCHQMLMAAKASLVHHEL